MAGIKIGSNSNSLLVQRNLAEAGRGVSLSSERLASGLRINHASDDAAGLAIASRLGANVRAYGQAIRNVNDAISVSNVAQGAISQLTQITQRQRELATQAANGTYTLRQRQALNAEANKLVEEFNRIVASTEFNGLRLYGAGSGSIDIQAGISSSSSLALALTSGLSRNVGDGTFTDGGASQATGTYPTYNVTGDFNRDGKVDVIVCADDVMTLFAGGGDGSLSAGTTILSTPGQTGYGMSVADFNNDGKQDVVCAFTSGAVHVLHGNGDGTFQDSSYSISGSAAQSTVGDFNSDGRLDFAVSGSGANTVNIFLQQTNGSFSAGAVLSTGSYPFGLTSGDVNGDGWIDIISDDDSAGKMSIFLGKGNGTFAAPLTFTTTFSSRSPILVDFNMDGKLDLAYASYVEYSGSSDFISVLLGNGDGTFQSRRMITANTNPMEVKSGDFNGDGIPDLMSANFNGNTVSVLLGNGDGTFAQSQDVATNQYPNSASVADMNGDGRSDVVVTEWLDGNVRVFLGSGSTSCGMQYLNMNTRQGALDAMSVIDETLQRLSNETSVIGAMQSRFSVALNNLYSSKDTVQAAESRITDVDVAFEAARLLQNRILQQTAASVLAQANQEPRIALTLLAAVRS